MNRLQLQLDGAPLDFDVQRVLVAGYTGRDTAQVRAHIAELERHGIPPPPSFPTSYPLDASYATTGNEIAVNAPRVSGEVEPALLFRSNSLSDALVSVIVDFTDREEERNSIARSKIFSKPLSDKVWRYSDVAGFWDNIALRSWVARERGDDLYQSGKLVQLLPPQELLDKLKLSEPLAGTVMLMGTVPLLHKEFQFTDYFACELETPNHGKLFYECTLRHLESR